jgi:hypothetical protein
VSQSSGATAGVEHPLIYNGRNIRIYAVNKGDEAPVKTFYEEDLNAQQRASVTAVFKLLDETQGRLSNREKYKDLIDYRGENFKSIKQHQTRIGCFWEPGYNLYLAHGFQKKGDDWPAGEIKKLKNIYDAYLALKNS